MNTTKNDNLAADYAKQISRGFYDADSAAPFGYRDDNGTEFDNIDDVLDDYSEREGFALGSPERVAVWEDHEAGNLPDGYRIATTSDYLEDALDFRYTIDSAREYRSGEICIGLGGPNVWLNLDNATVEVYWGSDKAVESIPREVANQLDDALAELWEMGA